MTTVYSNQMTITADVEPGPSQALAESVVPSPPIVSVPKPIIQHQPKRRKHRESYSRSVSGSRVEDDDDEEDIEEESSSKKRKLKRHQRSSSAIER